MKDNEFGLQAKTRQYGYVRFADRVDLHKQKSIAGKMFNHDSSVLSVCVFDKKGEVQLALRKNPTSLVCELREEAKGV